MTSVPWLLRICRLIFVQTLSVFTLFFLNQQVRELTASLDTQRELSGTLQAAVADLESRVAAEQAAVDAAKLRQGALQDELMSLRSELTNKALAVTETERLAQERALELDDLKLEASTAAAETAKLEEKCRTVQDSARHEVCMDMQRC